MKLLKLVIVDDEPILLKGLLETYDWNGMGYEVVGTAQSGEEALVVIDELRPDVVLTDIRMKQMTGLMVMEEIQNRELDCLFIVISAYREFEYAQQACDLGAFAYLLKPIEDEKLQETMQNAYQSCMEKLQNEAKYESWEKLLRSDSTSFLQVIVQKYLQNQIPYQKIEEVFSIISDVIEDGDRFIAVWVNVDISYKITHALEYEASRFSMVQQLEKVIGEQYFYWKFNNEEGQHIFLIKTKENAVVRELKTMLETIKKQQNYPIIAAISKPYMGMPGIKRSYEEAARLFELASVSGASAFTVTKELEEEHTAAYSADAELLIISAVRKNAEPELKEAFVNFIYTLPKEDEFQCQYLHKVMLQVEFMIKDSYGMTEGLREQFHNFYANLQNLNAARAIDVCYKVLQSATHERIKSGSGSETKYFSDYMAAAIAYIEEHLGDEELSIVSVATHIYLNPVYFGRVFKNTFGMTFKKYLMQQRMELAKHLILNGTDNMAAICESVGISNPSYFSHLFKQHTGILPSEYKRKHEV